MDLSDPQWWQDNASTQAQAVMAAPIPFLLAVGVVGVIIFWVVRAHYKERIETLDDTIAQKQSVIDDYKDKLGGGSPGDIASLVADLRGSVENIERMVNAPQRRLEGPSRVLFVTLLRDAEALRGFRILVGYSTDRESARYAKSIYDAIMEASVPAMMDVGRHDEGERGLILYLPASGERSEQAAALSDVLTNAGIAFTEASDRGMHRGSCYLHVAPEYD